MTKAIDIGERVRLAAILADFQVFLEQTLFGVSLDDILSMQTEDDLDALQAKSSGDSAPF